MRITIKNDGKVKHQSWEAVFNAAGTGWCVSAWAYGANEQEAREDLANRLLKAEMACRENVKTKPELIDCNECFDRHEPGKCTGPPVSYG